MRTAAGLPTEAVYVFTNMMRRMINEHHPDYIAAVWEGEGPTFRDEAFADYKANRDEMPSDLALQLPYIKRLLEAMRTPVIASDGYEADDTIGTLAKQAAAHDIDVYIVSSDKDLMQLVGDRVYLLNPMKNDAFYDSEGVKEFMGVEPKQVIDLLALKGDSVDNIPGAPGIGDKGAKQIIADYGSVEEAMKRAEEIKRKSYRESLQNNREQILLSKELATIALDAPIRLDIETLKAVEPDADVLRDLFRELEFQSLLSQIEEPAEKVELKITKLESTDGITAWLDARRESTIHSALDLAPVGEIAAGGIGLCAKPGDAAAAPADLLDALKPFFEDAARTKRVHDAKTMIRDLAWRGITLRGVVDDTMLAAFLCDSSRTEYSLDKAAARRFGAALEPEPAHAANAIARLSDPLSEELDAAGLRDLYETIELPLAAVLAEMEQIGVKLDTAMLERLSSELGTEIEGLSSEIQELAGRPFNVNSPKQLGEILFEDLALPAPPRRGKTKSLSTASDVLEGLEGQHPIAGKVLEYRQFSKLKSTYVDALPALIDPADERLHTTYNPTGSATGRLSSSNPNLQNIPVRTEVGRRIRAAFVAPVGCKLLAADYSQIELRVLAHMAGDSVLIDAFRKGEDIHTRTAAEVFGVGPLMVGAEERRRAKAVNFGIIYGLSPFGLAKQLGIPQKEARTYIDAYFELYSGVKKFIDRTIDQARMKGFATTLFGRRRPITDLDSRNPAQRGFAERIAVNSPIQGTAADLIKLAMIRVDHALRKSGMRSRMLLQVHDELLFETPLEEAEALGAMVKREMEEVRKLDVPLIADVKSGFNWRDMSSAG